MKLVPLLICLLLSTIQGFAQEKAFDVRAVRWGMSRDEVLKAETTQPVEVTPILVAYEDVEIGKYPTRIEYRFSQDKLISVSMLLTRASAVNDFKEVDRLLIEKYGNPDKHFNKSQATDNYFGTDTTALIRRGLYALLSSWKTSRSTILHSLGSELKHYISYKSVQQVIVKPATTKDF